MYSLRFAVVAGLLSGGLVAFAPAARADQEPGAPTCADTHTIAQLQGDAAISPLISITSLAPVVTTRGVVYARRADGFYMQMAVGDGDDTTSDGLFVFTGLNPSADAVLGNEVCVTGPLMEVVANGDATNLPVTQIRNPSSVVTLSTGNLLPTPVVITAEASTSGRLESLEGMRVQIDSLTVVGPTQGDTSNENERNATATSTGVFFGVVTGVARPFREAGVDVTSTVSAGVAYGFPDTGGPVRIAWDANKEPNIGGYVVAVGSTQVWAEQRIDVARSLSCTVRGLEPKGRYFAWVFAYDAEGRMSWPSEPLAFTVPVIAADTGAVVPQSYDMACELDGSCVLPVMQERGAKIRVDSAALGGRTVDVTSKVVVTGLVGPLDYAGHAFTLLPERAPTVTGNTSFAALPLAKVDELTIASWNLQRVYDTHDDLGVIDVALESRAYANRLVKASLATRKVLRLPDVLVVQGLETAGVLNDLAAQINADTSRDIAPSSYAGYLAEGNGLDGLDVGVLVNQGRLSITSVEQFGKGTTWINPQASPNC